MPPRLARGMDALGDLSGSEANEEEEEAEAEVAAGAAPAAAPARAAALHKPLHVGFAELQAAGFRGGPSVLLVGERPQSGPGPTYEWGTGQHGGGDDADGGAAAADRAATAHAAHGGVDAIIAASLRAAEQAAALRSARAQEAMLLRSEREKDKEKLSFNQREKARPGCFGSVRTRTRARVVVRGALPRTTEGGREQLLVADTGRPLSSRPPSLFSASASGDKRSAAPTSTRRVCLLEGWTTAPKGRQKNTTKRAPAFAHPPPCPPRRRNAFNEATANTATSIERSVGLESTVAPRRCRCRCRQLLSPALRCRLRALLQAETSAALTEPPSSSCSRRLTPAPGDSPQA